VKPDIFKKDNLKSAWRQMTTEYSHWLSFIVLVIVAIVVNPGFLSWNSLSNQFIQAAIVGICAMGMSLVISAGMIDLTVGSACAFISGMGVNVLNRTGSPWLCLLFCKEKSAGVRQVSTTHVISTKLQRVM
jgi:ribose transport system permease protein